MPTGWDVYYVVFLSAILALGVPATLKFVSLWISRRKAPHAPSAAPVYPPKEGAVQLGQRINARFFLAANAALVLITLMLVLIPCASTLQSGDSEKIWGLVSIVSIAVFAGLGLLYSARKGDLSWLATFDADKGKGR